MSFISLSGWLWQRHGMGCIPAHTLITRLLVEEHASMATSMKWMYSYKEYMRRISFTAAPTILTAAQLKCRGQSNDTTFTKVDQGRVGGTRGNASERYDGCLCRLVGTPYTIPTGAQPE